MSKEMTPRQKLREFMEKKWKKQMTRPVEFVFAEVIELLAAVVLEEKKPIFATAQEYAVSDMAEADQDEVTGHTPNRGRIR